MNHKNAKKPSMRLIASQLLLAFAAGAPMAAAAQTSEYRWWANQVKAYEAHNTLTYELGGYVYTPASRTGSGITVAVMDTGVSGHAEFGKRLLPGWSAYSGGTYDAQGHGTHVAGIAAAGLDGSRMVGIAPDTWILPIKVLSDSGSGSSATLFNGAQWAVQNYVKPVSGNPTNKTVFNMSLGGSSAFGLDTLRVIRNSGSISVVAAGNEGKSEVAYPARYATESTVAGWVIVVGAVDSANRMPSWSNRAGSVRNYYLVAPGVSIDSTYLNGSYATMSGTSMAAPVVSGAASVVWGAWPYLKGNQVVDSLLLSATDLGTAGVDATFGRGLLNLAAAMQPIGSHCVVTVIGDCGTSAYMGGTEPVPSGDTGETTEPEPAPTTKPGKGGGKTKTRSVATPVAAGNAVLLTNARVVGYDSVGRHFYFSAAELLNSSAPNLAQNVTGWMSNSQTVTTTGKRGLNSFSYQGNAATGVTSFSFTQAAASNSYVMGFKGNGLIPFGVSHSEFLSNAFVGGDALKIPFFGLMESPTGFAYGKNLSGGVGLRFGYMAGNAAANAYEISAEQLMLLSSNAVTLGEISAKFGNLQLVGTLGRFNENGAFLGASNPGLSANTSTAFVSLSATLEMGGGYHALASATHGKTRGDIQSGNFASIDTATQAFSLGVMKKSVFTKTDQFSLSATLPSRVVAGGLSLKAGVDVDMETGAPIFGVVPVALTPSGRERRFEASWLLPTKTGSLGVTAMHRLEPNHDATAKADNVVGLRYSQSF